MVSQQLKLLRKDNLDQIYLQSDHHLDQLMEAKRKSVIAIALTLASNESVQAILQSPNSTPDMYKRMQELSLSFRAHSQYKNVWIQLIDSDGISRSRSWSKKRDDSLIEIRADVREMIAKPEIKDVISTGIFTMSFKSMVPVYDDGKFIGIVEIITHFNSIIKNLLKQDIQSMVLVHPRYRKQLTKAYSKTFIEDYYVANFEPDSELISLFNRIGLNKLMAIEDYIIYENQLITLNRINNKLGKEMGYYFQFIPIEKIKNNNIDEFLFKIYTVTASFLIIIICLGYFYIRHNRKIENQKDFFHSVIDSSSDSIIVTDLNTIVDANRSFLQQFNIKNTYSGKKRLFNTVLSGINELDMMIERKSNESWKDYFINHVNKEIELGFMINGELHTFSVGIKKLKQDSELYVMRFINVTAQKHHKQQLEKMAHFDALTNLPNRILLSDRLNQAMIHASRSNHLLTVVFLDLDGFKEVNDIYGHNVGDELLITLSSLMKATLRQGDTLARIGGDEFVAILLDTNSLHDSKILVKRLLDAVKRPQHLDNRTVQVSASIGLTLYPQRNIVDADQLIRQADQAMYQAKMAGKNCYQVFDIETNEHILGRHQTLAIIRQALHAEQFVMYYQPKVNMKTGQVIGAEALIRWRHPERGILSPVHFLPAIENDRLELELGEWVISNVLNQIHKWESMGLDLVVSLNVSALQLQQENFFERLVHLLDINPDIETKHLKIEVLENGALSDIEHVSKVMKQCQAIGIEFALDDFGTGYSSLTYLKRLPSNEIKIDQSFIRDMLAAPDDLTILKGIIGLAHAFNRVPIAEGVETLEHGLMLLRLGCPLAQGYAIARPMPCEEFPPWITSWKPADIWINSIAVDSVNLPAVFASVEHRAWLLHIKQYLKGQNDMPPAMDHHRCNFGCWIDSKGGQPYDGNEQFNKVKSLHEEVHKSAQELIVLKWEKGITVTPSQFSDLQQLSDNLMIHLNQLLEEVCEEST